MTSDSRPPRPKDSYLAGGGPAGAEAFRSRTRADASAAGSALLGAADEHGALGLRDRRVRLLLLLVFLLQLLSLRHLEGYQLADAVEYMDRAQDVAQGIPLDESTARSFAFSALLLPVFATAEALGLDDLRPVVLVVRLLQMLLGLLAVAATVRIGSRLAGRGGGLAAGFLLGVNPVFLQFTVSPLSATAATLCVVLALERLIDPPDLRRGTQAGAWLGLGMIFAFQVIPIAGLALVMVLVRGRLRRWKPLLGMLLGISVFVAAQVGLDRLIYGSYGSSLLAYLTSNVVGILTRWLWELGFPKAGLWIYDTFGEQSINMEKRTTVGDAQLQAPTWYFDHLRLCLVLPALGLVLAGAAAGLRRRSWMFWLLAFELAVNVALTSTKGSKSFRLWMPILPMFAVFGGLGWSALRGAADASGAGVRRLFANAVLLAAAGLGVSVLLGTNMKKFGGYWRAMDMVNAAAREASAGGGAVPLGEDGAPRRLRVASAYHWAVRFRDSKDVELVRLSNQLDLFPLMLPEEQAGVLGELETLDWFLGHGQVLTQHPRVMEVINRRMEIAAVIYDRESFEELAPIYVMRPRGSGAPDAPAHTFFDVLPNADVEAHGAAIRQRVSVDFRRRTDDGVRQLVLLGWDLDPGLDDEQAWIKYHWWAGPLAGHDYTIVDRITFGDRGAWQNNHQPTYGVHPTSTWEPGWVVTESFPLLLPTDPLEFGGAYCRGDLVPARLWLAVSERDEHDQPIGGLAPFGPAGQNPRPKQRVPSGIESGDGRIWSHDSLFLAGGFWLPVPAAARVPDDGHRIEDRD